MTRVGEWIQTASGRKFYPLDPREDEIFIEDLAHHLANQCRFGGACRDLYSVAQHSVLGSLEIARRGGSSVEQLQFLVHDGSEGLGLPDLTRPVKRFSKFGEIYCEVEDPIQRAVYRRFGLPEKAAPAIHEMDDVMLLTERRDIMAPPPEPWREDDRPRELLAERIVFWTPREAHFWFLFRLFELTEGYGQPERCQALVVETRGEKCWQNVPFSVEGEV